VYLVKARAQAILAYVLFVIASHPNPLHPGRDSNRRPSLFPQNFTASEVFVQGLAGVVNQQDVESMIRAQKKMCVFFWVPFLGEGAVDQNYRELQ
jgi:hypothetical protein